jgi:hypothetical protein
MFDSIAHPKKRAFLAAFCESGIVKIAANTAEISRELHYDWKAQDLEYAAAFALAERIAGDLLEDIARQRAYAKSDRLLAFLLTAAKPEKYGKKLEHSGAIAVVHTVDLTAFSDEELELLGKLAAKATQPAGDRGGDRTPPAEQDSETLS